MATITNRNLVNDIIRGNGHYERDPRVVKIVEYDMAHSKHPFYGLVYENDREPDRYEQLGWCLNPRVIWKADGKHIYGRERGYVEQADPGEGYAPDDPKGDMLRNQGWENV